jgi:hypothetical protein
MRAHTNLNCCCILHDVGIPVHIHMQIFNLRASKMKDWHIDALKLSL